MGIWSSPAILWDILEISMNQSMTCELEKNRIRIALRICSVICLIVSVAVSVYAYRKGLFTSQDAMRSYIAGFGKMGIAVFIVFQIVQVVVPVIPGGLGCLAGVLMFGPLYGFAYNYIGICLGSLIAFFISRNFGKTILYTFFSKKALAKYEAWTGNESQFAKWFALAIFFPVAPDDLLCYLAGTTQMRWKQYIAIILLGKPASIALYSVGLNALFSKILSLAQ